MKRNELMRLVGVGSGNNPSSAQRGRESSFFKHGLFSGFAEYRYGAEAKPVTLAKSVSDPSATTDHIGIVGKRARPILSVGKRKAMADRVEALFKDWHRTPFENEGPIRHGLREAFCLDGYPWRQADNEAEFLTDRAIRALGIQRPTFEQGQRDFAGECDYCSWCHGPIDDEGRTRRQRFCSAECATMALTHRSKAVEKHDGGVRRSATRLVSKEKAPARPCEYCGTMFKSDREDARFCSTTCVTRWTCGDRLLKDITCEGCGKVCKPVNRGQKYCSLSCRTVTIQARERDRLSTVVRQCQCCGDDFTPTMEKGIYCSPRCASNMANRAYHARKRAEKQPHHFACQCCGEGFTTHIPWAKFCSTSCATVAKKFDADKLRWLAPRAFDYLIRQAGARVTTDFMAEAA